jgi:hypothetical protein
MVVDTSAGQASRRTKLYAGIERITFAARQGAANLLNTTKQALPEQAPYFDNELLLC